MGKERGRNDDRSRIAHLAARIMAADGVEDYFTAKRKAARQAGVPDTRQLPTNEEVDEALRVYQALFVGETHRERLRELREHALAVMQDLERFNPYLTGSVLSGNAGKYADIDLHLYTDSAKAVEIFLLDNGIPYWAGQVRLYVGAQFSTVPTYTLNDDGIEVQVTVLSLDDLRHPVRTSADGKPLERARRAAVQTLLDAV